MDTKERIAPWLLALSVVALVAAAAEYYIWRGWKPTVLLTLGVAVLAIAVYMLLVPEKVRAALTGRQARYGSNALVLSLAFIGILAVINYIGYQYPKRWDLTADKTHTLDKVTIDTLKQLPKPVKAIAFYSKRIPRDTAKNLLDQYQFASHGKFKYEFVDPEAQPALAKKMGITRDGTIVLQMGDQTVKVTDATEEDLTAGLVKLLHPTKQVVYFLVGHGEHTPDKYGDSGYTFARRELQNKNYTVKVLTLAGKKEVPEDANVIIIAGPQKPLADSEVKLLKEYVDKGGSLVVMLEPPLSNPNGKYPLVDYLQKEWHLILKPDIIIDPLANPATFIASYQYGYHEITRGLEGTATIFPTARSVQTQLPVPEGFNISTLVRSEPKSWAETNLVALQKKEQLKEDKDDIKGPVPLAAALLNTKTKARIVVVGDSDFASNAYYAAYGNSNFFLSIVDWAAKQQKLIHLNPHQTTQRMIILPRRDTLALLFLAYVIGLPALVLIAGAIVWANRKRRA